MGGGGGCRCPEAAPMMVFSMFRRGPILPVLASAMEWKRSDNKVLKGVGGTPSLPYSFHDSFKFYHVLVLLQRIVSFLPFKELGFPTLSLSSQESRPQSGSTLQELLP